MTKRIGLVLLGIVLAAGTVFGLRERHTAPHLSVRQFVTGPTLPPAVPLTPRQARIIAGARAQVGDAYDASYCTLSYPNGDPPQGRGACTDVVIRSLRADGADLQALVHADMARHWDRYPRKWGLARPDPNIDHRRVPNLAVFFKAHGETLPSAVTPETLPTWQPGDIVCWKLPSGLDHIGIVSDRRDPAGVPLVIHNMGRCDEQDVLTLWTIAGHYRYPMKTSGIIAL